LGDLKKNPTLKEIIDAHAERKAYSQYLFLARYVLYPLGFLLTWICIRIRFTTETVAWLSGLVGLLGYLCLISGRESLLVPGIGFLVFFNLLDCVDGSIARTMKTQNPYGKFLDSIMVWIDLGFWALIGIMAYRHSNLYFLFDSWIQNPLSWLAVGGLASYFSILANYIELIFDRSAREAWDEIINKPNSDTYKFNTEETVSVNKPGESSQFPFRRFIVIINHNLRVRETHYLLLILAFALNLIDLFLILFLFYYFSLTIALVFIYSRRCKYLRDMTA
jgi:hypothetical protein